MTYRELQTALKAFRSQGLDVKVKLTASFDTLQAEYNRLSAITSLSYANAQPVSPEPPSQQLEQAQVQPQEGLVMTTDSFNEWVGLPYEQTSEPVVDITSVQVVEPNQDTPQARSIEYI